MAPTTNGLPAARAATSPLVCAAQAVAAERMRRSRSGAMETGQGERRRRKGWEGDREKTHVEPSFRASVPASSSSSLSFSLFGVDGAETCAPKVADDGQREEQAAATELQIVEKIGALKKNKGLD